MSPALVATLPAETPLAAATMSTSLPVIGKNAQVVLADLDFKLKLPEPHPAAAIASVAWAMISRTADAGIPPDRSNPNTLVWPNYEGRVGNYTVSFKDIGSTGVTMPVTAGNISYTNETGNKLEITYGDGRMMIQLDGKDVTGRDAQNHFAKKCLALAKEFILTAPLATAAEKIETERKPFLDRIDQF